MHLLARLTWIILFLVSVPGAALAKPKIHVAFQWHMHQPIYWTGEALVTTAQASRWGFNVLDIHHTRSGPYTAWPRNAVRQGLDLPHLGAQVSFTGSLIENLNGMAQAGMGFSGWSSQWRDSRAELTSLSNPRLDLVLIGYFHPLLPLIPAQDRRLHLALHRRVLAREFGESAGRTKGMFPPETAFSPHIIPELVAEGVQWVLIDNIHMERARPDYPHAKESGLFPPNQADQRNRRGETSWVQLRDIWAGSKVGAPWAYQPHWVAHVDPATGKTSKIIAVPAARYEGNEDGRGGFGALQYEKVMSQYEQHNTDDAHPMLVVLHHDGDNYGGGTDSYYHSNFGAFVSWIKANPERFEATTVQDYLDRFPPDPRDIIHVEPGSWSGADNGDPEYRKWNGPPQQGYSPDRVSWAVVTAAANRVHTAQAIAPYGSLDAIMRGEGTDTERAWRYLLESETSCYWYWDGSEGGKWDSQAARGANLAVAHAEKVIGDGARDTVGPTIFLPQRSPYNPGALEWSQTPEARDFDVWTYVDDVSGLAEVKLFVREHPGQHVRRESHLLEGGAWRALPMERMTLSATTTPAPRHMADEFRVKVTGVKDGLVDYYVSAVDMRGNRAISTLQHVVVGRVTSLPSDPADLPDQPQTDGGQPDPIDDGGTCCDGSDGGTSGAGDDAGMGEGGGAGQTGGTGQGGAGASGGGAGDSDGADAGGRQPFTPRGGCATSTSVPLGWSLLSALAFWLFRGRKR